MAMRPAEERLAVLEEQRKEHESRHDRLEKWLEQRFEGFEEVLVANGYRVRGGGATRSIRVVAEKSSPYAAMLTIVLILIREFFG